MPTPFTSPELPLSRRDAEGLLRDAVETGGMERGAARRVARAIGRDRQTLDAAAEAAGEAKRRAFGATVTVSPNVFIPLTNLCRNRCSYCTFAKGPANPDAKTYTLDEVAATCQAARRSRCLEALFCLGDKPELAFKSYRAWLADRGHETTADYLLEACRTAVERGMLPHTNAGLLTREQMARLRPYNASMGLMLESTSPRLRTRGQAHFSAPDKEPALRLRMHREAGELGIPFTSGILLGIGENDDERVDTLLAIRALADRYGHIQEAIVQPFHPKSDTKMREQKALHDDRVVGWVAMARLLLGPGIHVQAPPNLAELASEPREGGELLERLLRAGVDDWGGISPLSIDFINPEAPWPAMEQLRARTAAAGGELRERLPIYPERAGSWPDFYAPALRARLRAASDADGYARPRETREEAA